MEDESSVIYGLEFPCRTLAAQKAESEAIRFFVGTQCLRENQIHLVEYDDDINVVNKTVFPFDDEIWVSVRFEPRLCFEWRISKGPKAVTKLSLGDFANQYKNA